MHRTQPVPNTRVLERDRARKRARRQHLLSQGIRHGILLLFTLITLAPFLWALSTSLRPRNEILTWPPQLLPSTWTWEHYQRVIFDAQFLRFGLNSIIVTTLTVIVAVTVSCLAGYAAARYRFPGKTFIMFLILAGMAIGRFANVVPLYFFGQQLGLLDTYLILVLSYSAFVTPITTWLMQSYYKTIPPSLEEAAKIDGCTTFGAFWRVILPVVRPGIVASAVIAMVHAWNEFILALVLTSSTSMRTLPVGLHLFLTDYGVNWGSLTAAAIVAIIPILLAFFWLQRQFFQGLTAGTLGGT